MLPIELRKEIFLYKPTLEFFEIFSSDERRALISRLRRELPYVDGQYFLYFIGENDSLDFVYEAARTGRIDVVHDMYNREYINLQRIACEAAKGGIIELVQRLVPNYVTAYEKIACSAAEYGYNEIIGFLYNFSGFDLNPIVVAALKGNNIDLILSINPILVSPKSWARIIAYKLIDGDFEVVQSIVNLAGNYYLQLDEQEKVNLKATIYAERNDKMMLNKLNYTNRDEVAQCAAKEGYNELAEYIWPNDLDKLIIASIQGNCYHNIYMFGKNYQRIVECAAEADNKELVFELISKTDVTNFKSIILSAAKGGSIEIIYRLRQSNRFIHFNNRELHNIDPSIVRYIQESQYY